MVERFRTTIDGGFVLGRASNLPAAVNYAKSALQRGNRVYVKNTTTSHTMILKPGEEPAFTNMVGDPIDPPNWADKAQQLLKF